MIEVVIAIGIFGLVSAFVSGMLATGLRGTLLAKRREVAIQEASRLLELARSLSYNELGLAQPSADPTISTDTAIQSQGGVLSYLIDDADPDLWEPIMWALNPTGHPFNPHRSSFKRGATTLTRYVYVSGHDANYDGAVDFKRVSVRVTWNEAGTQGPVPEVRAQTYIHPGGLVSAPTGASGSGPTGPSGSGTTTGLTPMTADASAASVTGAVKSARGDLATLTNAVLPANPVLLTQPTSQGRTTFRALSTVDCASTSTFLQGGATHGRHPAVAFADDDSRTDAEENPPDTSWSGSPPDSIGGGTDVDDLVVETSFASSVSCHASALPPVGAPPPEDDRLPHERGTGSGPTTLTMTEDLTGAGLPSSLLTILEAPNPTITQDIDHALVSGTREIWAASTVNNGGATRVMVIPGVMEQGLVRVDPFSYDASLAASPLTPSRAPDVNVSAPIQLQVFDPAAAIPSCTSRSGSYCNLTIDPLAAGFTGRNVDVSGSVLANGGLTNVGFKVTVQALPPNVGPAAGTLGPDGERRWVADYVPLAVTTELTIDVTVLGAGTVTLVRSTADLGFGQVSVDGCAGAVCFR